MSPAAPFRPCESHTGPDFRPSTGPVGSNLSSLLLLGISLLIYWGRHPKAKTHICCYAYLTVLNCTRHPKAKTRICCYAYLPCETLPGVHIGKYAYSLVTRFCPDTRFVPVIAALGNECFPWQKNLSLIISKFITLQREFIFV